MGHESSERTLLCVLNQRLRRSDDGGGQGIWERGEKGILGQEAVGGRRRRSSVGVASPHTSRSRALALAGGCGGCPPLGAQSLCVVYVALAFDRCARARCELDRDDRLKFDQNNGCDNSIEVVVGWEEVDRASTFL
jgi:hypothetical protein